MNRLKFTLKAWPVVAAATIGLCFLTQLVAKLFGVELPDQAQVEFVRRYAGWNLTFAFIVAQIVVIVPAFEEVLFRWLLWRLPAGGRSGTRGIVVAIASSALFSFAHYVDYQAFFSSRTFALTGWNSAFLALFLFGLAQCWLYRRTGRLWCPMLNHALFNLTNLALLFAIPGQ